jgi:hypothetical protein
VQHRRAAASARLEHVRALAQHHEPEREVQLKGAAQDGARRRQRRVVDVEHRPVKQRRGVVALRRRGARRRVKRWRRHTARAAVAQRRHGAHRRHV